MKIVLPTLLAACAALATPARAAPYTIEPVKNPAGEVVACQAINAASGVLFLAAGDHVVMFAQSSKFPFGKTDKVAGTWAVDGDKPAAFTSDGGGAQMVAIDVPNTAEAVAALTSGKTLAVVAKGIKASFELAGTSDAFSGLIQCMSDAAK